MSAEDEWDESASLKRAEAEDSVHDLPGGSSYGYEQDQQTDTNGNGSMDAATSDMQPEESNEAATLAAVDEKSIVDANVDADDTGVIESGVRVVVRVRPLLDSEVARAHSCSLVQIGHERVRAHPSESAAAQSNRNVDCDGGGNKRSQPPLAKEISIGLKEGGVHTFAFDGVLTPQHGQVDVYEAGGVERMLKALLKGFHGTIFAYGQTGSGKTKTMDGIDYSMKQVSVSMSSVGPAAAAAAAAAAQAQSQAQANSDAPTFVPPTRTKMVRVLKEPSAQESGLSLRCINELFRMLQAEQQAGTSEYGRYTIKCSFIQIYQESVYDLLADSAPNYVSRQGSAARKSQPSSSSSSGAGLRVRWSRSKDFYIENLYIFECSSAKEARSYFLNGMKKRLVASHRMNISSSRSHSIFTLYLERRHNHDPDQIISSRLSLVDLAGSERASQTGATGRTLDESIGINQSLFVLRRVIKALSKINQTTQNAASRRKALAQVPYRDSTLTRLLKHSLGGSCLTLMVACVNPSDAYAEENLSTLNYAALTKKIHNSAVLNEDPKTALIRKLRAEIKMLRGMLAHAHQSFTFDQDAGTLRQHDQRQRQSQSQGQSQSQSHGVAAGKKMIAQSSNLIAHHGIAEKLIDSVNIIKELLHDNNELREMYDEKAAALDELEFSNATLNNENDELRDRIHFLETVIVDAQGEEILKSPDEGLIVEADGDEQSPTNKEEEDEVTPFEVAELRAENERLKAIIAAQFSSTRDMQTPRSPSSSRSLPPSHRHSGSNFRPSSSSFFTPLSSASASPMSYLSSGGVDPYGHDVSTVATNPRSLYVNPSPFPTAVLSTSPEQETLHSLRQQGRKGRIQSGGHGQRRAQTSDVTQRRRPSDATSSARSSIPTRPNVSVSAPRSSVSQSARGSRQTTSSSSNTVILPSGAVAPASIAQFLQMSTGRGTTSNTHASPYAQSTPRSRRH